jgi:hypothetical protein
MENNLTYHEAIDKLSGWPTNCPLRVEKKVARRFLLENTGVVCGANVFFFGIRDLGLNVCEVWKADLHQRENKMFPRKK